jgi:hypothetical protein
MGCRVTVGRTLQAGELDVSFEQLYQDVVTQVAEVVMEELVHTHLIVIPSLRDASHDCIFPQAPLPVVEHEVEGRAGNASALCLFTALPLR